MAANTQLKRIQCLPEHGHGFTGVEFDVEGKVALQSRHIGIPIEMPQTPFMTTVPPFRAQVFVCCIA